MLRLIFDLYACSRLLQCASGLSGDDESLFEAYLMHNWLIKRYFRCYFEENIGFQGTHEPSYTVIVLNSFGNEKDEWVIVTSDQRYS